MGVRNHPEQRKPPEESLIEIGKITKTVGVHGEVRIYPLTREPQGLERYGRFIALSADGIAKKIIPESFRVKAPFIILKISGINSIAEAEELIGCKLFIQEDQLYSLNENEYLIRDLIGLKVFSTDGEPLGVLEDVLELPAQDVYLIRAETREILVPAVKEFICEVNVVDRRMVIKWDEGLENRP